MLSETEILNVMDALADLLEEETTLLKQHKNEEALKLLDRKEMLTHEYGRAQETLELMTKPSSQFLKEAKKKFTRLNENIRESIKVLEVILSANEKIMNAVVDRLNVKNRPTMMYGANARTMNLNKFMPPAMTLNQNL